MIKRWTESRVWVLGVGVAAILALATLSAGLPNLRFRQPGAFIIEQKKPISLAPVASLPNDSAWLVRLIIVLTVLSAIGLLIALFNKKARKLLLKFLLYGTLLLIISNLIPSRADERKSTSPPAAVSAGGLVQQGSPPPYVPPRVSPWTAFMVALGIVLLAMGVGWYIWRRQRPTPTGYLSLPGLRRIAESALDDLASGQNWRDAVILCYAQMTEAVASQRGLVRRPSMTAEEFAGRLTQAGLPPQSVLRLTQLFESARYGSRRSSRAEADEAVACLQEIVAAGGGAA